MDKTSAIGDMPDKEFREYGYRIVDKIADYFKEMENLPVLSQNEPNDLKSKLPPSAPDQGEEFAEVLKDMDDLIIPALSHWNHPNFHGLFSTSTSSVGVFGEMFIAAFDQKAMLWRTSPASTELEEITLNWLRELMGLPEQFSGLIYDTASVSTMHAIAAARERKGLRIREDGMSGRDDLPLLRVYGSDQTHSSIEKSLITLGLGQRSMCAVKTNDRYSIDVDELRASIERDISNGFEPLCVVATIGTTSTASSDDLQAIAEICEANDIWLHVDMAYAGSAMILPELQHFMDGIESADSVVTNPHKWLFTPFDLSVLYMKDMEILRKAFSLVPEYLKVAEDVTNQMDYGIQLGRRFRSLKLWFVIRYFGADGLRSRIREHIRLAKLFASWVEESERFQLSADVDFALVCFRAVPERVEDLNSFNETLMNEINREGGAYLSHTKLDDQIVLRLSVGSIRAEERHLIKTWKLLNAKLEELCDN